ncbi:MAG: PQQ-dependent sugar dehydrogenase [Hydrogenophaga sp.]|uniref:PQQ-dependent sugar dehydrogenase n=1 Tax=Hydrogenophaga sp. TaxID=1904254 RepID=UPI00169DD7C1|nr:PQQ-dependent sugar dehydrogenase [Hydrogenophaga sp.]NIM40690.1 PQQ-dependent sugar dehydrogenase [Hydrogenophaga sp.]NIN26165.1 PQQ-dependent sugar dehydrogenase [Hydrogenophaga sp.]NIN31030.1 PQQ-dependent sugar dehydrogenase [Hydrogenophaga sp.]NIN55073.1 PQQ-dependent sugar dehydrogenase [Hydrogenophaga sp.]NIO51116.1 PQQ-dependent sugar dehydrogenase [Hydrogenophaga sp.]
MVRFPLPGLSHALVALGLCGALWSCGGGGGGDSGEPGGGGGSQPPGSGNTPAFIPTTTPVTVTEVAAGLSNPWGLAFLPDGRMLITGRTGQLWLLSADGSTRQSISGLPSGLSTGGQGGLLDVALDPSFAANRRVYFTFSEVDPGNASINGTAVARAELDTGSSSLVGLTVIYRQLPKVASSGHFGSRLVFDNSGHLFVTLGDRQNADQAPFAQDLSRGNGKVARIETDGDPAPGNPFAAIGPQAHFWSYGHRNPQGAALHPGTGELWISEHGPQGGDEINRVLAGLNYGWPVISHGQQYGTTTQWGEGTAKAGMEQPVSVWETRDGTPWTSGQKSSTAPAGMTFFTGSGPAHWQGSLFVGALAGQALWRLQLDGNTVVGRERFLASLGERIRDVQQGPDGRLYLLTDSGRLLRVNA